jgi:hypothetical protein
MGVKCLLLLCREAKAQRVGLLLQGFVKIEKLIAQMTEIIIKSLTVVAGKYIFPDGSDVHIVEDETAE